VALWKPEAQDPNPPNNWTDHRYQRVRPHGLPTTTKSARVDGDYASPSGCAPIANEHADANQVINVADPASDTKRDGDHRADRDSASSHPVKSAGGDTVDINAIGVRPPHQRQRESVSIPRPIEAETRRHFQGTGDPQRQCGEPAPPSRFPQGRIRAEYDQFQ